MKPFAYVNPTNEKDAVAALSPEHEKAMPIGGGQDLLARMKDYVTQPDRIVNVKNALESTVAAANGGLKIGAAMKMVDVAEHADIARLYATLRYGPASERSAEFIAELRARVGALPRARELRAKT